ncbi:MAG: hypothetical protein ACOC93_00915 [Planctomycetota bacterium]
MSHAVADLFRQAADLNEHDPQRHGATVYPPADCDIVLAGDIHGHRRNFTRIIAAADLGNHPNRRLILQELIHGPDDPRTGTDRSIEMAMRAARLKLQHPGQVVFIMANHDAAQITGSEITKQGRGSIQAFKEGLADNYPDDVEEILDAVEEFLRSQPLAVQTPGGVLATHSLPHPKRMEMAGTDILGRDYREEDFRRGQPVYEWTWGRRHTPEQLEELAEWLEVSFFAIGHQHVEQGWETIGQRGVVIASDHERGCLLHFAADETLTGDNVASHVHQIAMLSGALAPIGN